MLSSRLLLLSLFLALSTALLAQSSPGNNPLVRQFTGSGQQNSSAPVDLLSFQNPKTELDPYPPMDRLRVQALNELDLTQDDSLCYSIRNYKVARDGPQSDSTHAVGYSICQPAARFRMHTTELRVLQATP